MLQNSDLRAHLTRAIVALMPVSASPLQRAICAHISREVTRRLASHTDPARRTKAALARHLGARPSDIGTRLSSRPAWSLGALATVAEYLGCTPAELLAGFDSAPTCADVAAVIATCDRRA